MKRLLLTSNGLSNLRLIKEAKKLLTKPADETKVLVMYTLRKKSYVKYLRRTKKQLIKLGIKRKNIICINISKKIKKPNLDFDIFYSCGGNTFYILDRIRKTGFDKIIKSFVKKGGFYVGLSAGSIIVHKTIELAGWGRERDLNDINLKNLTGLKITNTMVFPHYRAGLKKEVDEFKKIVNYPVIELRDGRALLILGNKFKRV